MGGGFFVGFCSFVVGFFCLSGIFVVLGCFGFFFWGGRVVFCWVFLNQEWWGILPDTYGKSEYTTSPKPLLCSHIHQVLQRIPINNKAKVVAKAILTILLCIMFTKG